MHKANNPLHNVQRARSPVSPVKADWTRGGRNLRSSGSKVCAALILKNTVKALTNHAKSVETDVDTPRAKLILSESVRAATTCAPAARTHSHSGLSSRTPCRNVPAPQGVSAAGFKLCPAICRRARNKACLLAFSGADLIKF
jgi:hypothetical protein